MTTERPVQGVEVLAAEDAGERADGEEESTSAANPTPASEVESSGGDDAVQVDVEREILSPGVEHGDDGGLGAEVSSVPGELEQGAGGGLKEQPVDEPRTMDRDAIEPMGKREDYVEVVHGEELLRTCVEPSFLG